MPVVSVRFVSLNAEMDPRPSGACCMALALSALEFVGVVACGGTELPTHPATRTEARARPRTTRDCKRLPAPERAGEDMSFLATGLGACGLALAEPRAPEPRAPSPAASHRAGGNAVGRGVAARDDGHR